MFCAVFLQYYWFPWSWRKRNGKKTLRQSGSSKTLMPLTNSVFVWGAGIPRGVSEPGWSLLYSDKGCRKLNGTVFYLILKLARGLDNNFCAFICFSFFVYYRAYTSTCTYTTSRDFLQITLNSEINACFLLKELSDLYFNCKILV